MQNNHRAPDPSAKSVVDVRLCRHVLCDPGTAPHTGSLPAVEMKHGLGGDTGAARDDLEAAQACIDFVKRDTNLDGWLPGATAAECVAFNCLLDTTLAEALRYSMWCEWASLAQLPVRSLVLLCCVLELRFLETGSCNLSLN